MFPFTSYSWWFDRFDAVALWQPYGGPGGFNDYDSIEVGDGTAASGMSVPAEQSQLSLWALGSAPFILGVNLTNKVTNAFGTSQGLTPDGLAMLENRGVIAVDQDAIDASRISSRTPLRSSRRLSHVVTRASDCSTPIRPPAPHLS